MGLLLSILVACVGVVELFDFYYNIKRNLIIPQLNNSLIDIKKQYRNELDKYHHHQQQNCPKIKCNGVTPTNEEIELEFEHYEIEHRSRTPSPRKYLLTEKQCENRPRKFHVTQTENVENLPEFQIKEKKGSPQKYLIKNEPNNLPPIPLPKQFLVSESMSPEIVENHQDITDQSQSIPLSFHDDNDDYYRRSPSPYPSLLINVPRNSICNELQEVDEESKSPTPEIAEIVLQSYHNTCDYWNNTITIIPKHIRKIRSRTPDFTQNSKQLERKKSKSESEISNEISHVYNTKFLNSLDGVDKQKLSNRSGKLRKRKTKDDNLSSSNDTAKTLTEAANLLKTVNHNKKNDGGGDEVGGPSTDRTNTTPEPFWVNL